jgi:hypothetical protein
VCEGEKRGAAATGERERRRLESKALFLD